MSLAFICLSADASDLASVGQHITVVSDDNYPPYIFRDESGKLDGYLVDIWKLWQKKTGVTVDLVATDWATALTAIRDGRADAIDTIFETPDREAWLDFSPVYANIPVSIFAHASVGGIVDISTLRRFSAISNAEQQALHENWMGTSLAIVPWGRYLIYGFIAALLFGAMLAIWGVLLRQQVRQQTRALENERGHLRTLISTLPDLVWLKDLDGIYLGCNSAFERLYGATEKEIVGKTDYDFVDAELADFFRKNDAAALSANASRTNEEWLTFPDNGYRGLFETTKTPMRDSRGQVIGVLGIAHDITALKQSRQALDFLAYHDPLTKLPNRLLFRDRLDHAIERAKRDGSALAILFVDLDRFKNVNDALGHLAGDDLLREVAQRMLAQIRASDTVARLGGDEFILLIEEDADRQEIANIAAKLLSLFAQPWEIQGRSLFVGASIGISRYPVDGTSADTLIKHADMAMYRAKQEGRNTHRFFEPEQDSEAMERMLLENMLRGAIARDELLLHYQPQIDLHTGDLIGVEALLRWQHPELDLIAPGRFIPIAEEIGIVAEIGDWVFRRCCAQLAQWRVQGIAVPRVSINLSVQQAERQDLAAWMQQTLDEFGLAAHDVDLEVTESLLMQQSGHGMLVLDNLEAMGIRVSVDDFGTGYSSLAYLKRMPVHCLKIDRSFIADIGNHSQGEVIVRAIIALAKSLMLDVIAEGVETQQQIDFLLAENCTVAQGYFFSRPVPAEEITERYAIA